MSEAFQRQVIYGGALDTIILEMGILGEVPLTAYLAQGDLLEDAADKAKGFVHEALAQATRAGRYRPLNFFWTADDEPVS